MHDIGEDAEEVLVGFGHFDDVGARFPVVLDNLVVRLAFNDSAIAKADVADRIFHTDIVITTGRNYKNVVGRDGRC